MKKERKPRKRIDFRPTRWQVAQKAGVSVATVSNALLNTPGKRIGEETRDRVRRIARELGYTPNFVGRALQTGRSFNIGVLQPSHQSVLVLFYQSMIYGMVSSMAPDDYHLMVLFRSEEESAIKVVEQGRVDGMFVLQSDRDSRVIERVHDTRIPTVVVNTHYENSGRLRLGCVCSDHEQMMTDVVREFHALGCRSIVQIHDHRVWDANYRMFDAFQAEAARLAPDGVVASSLLPNRTVFQTQMENAFAAGQRWDGVFVDGTEYAEMYVQAGLKAGLQPNRDYRLISASTTPGGRTPSGSEVSAYTQQPEEIGRQAWGMMKRLMEGDQTLPVVRVPYVRAPVAASA